MHARNIKNQWPIGILRLVLPLVIILSFAGASLALNPEMATDQYLYRAWTTREGFPQNTAQSLLQTRDGYMWFGTQGGLSRYDGHRFKTFTAKNTEHLSSLTISCLLEGSDGVLWIGTEQGPARYTGAQFEGVSRGDDVLRGLVTTMDEDAEGRIWFGTTGPTLYYYADGLIESMNIDKTQKTLWVHKLLFSRAEHSG